MTLGVNSISLACTKIRDFLKDRLKNGGSDVHVTIGNPADASAQQAESKQLLNLFFYRFEPAGFGANALPTEPWLIRLHCLMTAFGGKEGQVSSGENDLRILGEVARLFHETPVSPEIDYNGRKMRLQVVFQPLDLEAIHSLWGTQNNVSYRPSLAYELALVPVVPEKTRVGAALVGSLGLAARGTIASQTEPFDGAALPPPVEPVVVDVNRADWAPRICFVEGSHCAASLSFTVSGAAAVTPHVWVAGDPEVTVTLKWDVWDSNDGWRPDPTTTTTNCLSTSIDPDSPPPVDETQAIELPFRDRAGQAVLYAVRQYRPHGDPRDRHARSNPLLVTLYNANT